ncbi:Actin patch 1 protein [Mycena kentingensis (nom. inval.)]|nr:Actin patch 1 protein [Mycena kentingensis (nom. inval.)]
MLPLWLLALLVHAAAGSPLRPTPAPARVTPRDAQPTPFAGKRRDLFDAWPSGDAVKSSLGLADDQVAALPTQVLNLPCVPPFCYSDLMFILSQRSYASWTDNGWNLLVHGNVYKQPEIVQEKLDDLANFFLIDTSVAQLSENEAKNARNLTREIFILQQGDVPVGMSIHGGQVQTAVIGPTTDQGDFLQSVPLTDAAQGYQAGSDTSQIQTMDVFVDGTDSGNSTAYLVPPTGYTIISDIDDILRITKIYIPKEGLLNSFARDFVPWMSMPDVFYSWAQKAPDLHFHYLTTTPEQGTRVYMHYIYQTYPMGSFDTRPLNFSDISATLEIRKHLLTRIIETFPQRKFILVADTTNSDVMKAYPEMAHTYPDQIHCILLRNTSATDDENHFPYDTSGFEGLDQSKYMFFRTPDDLMGSDITKDCYNSAVPQNVTFSNQNLPWGLCVPNLVHPPAWRTLIHQTPLFWTDIAVKLDLLYDRAEAQVNAIEAALQRSGRAPLKIHIHALNPIVLPAQLGVLASMTEHCARWKLLWMSIPPSDHL